MAFNVQHTNTRHASFWGECSATLDWCEENYHHTPFIAEFWNTISNFGYIVVGLMGTKQCLAVRSQIPVRYAFLFTWMAAIGVGSLMFHATLKYSMQLLDEIPMLFSNSQLLYCLWHPSIGLKFAENIPLSIRSRAWPYYAFSLLITGLYVTFPACTLFFQICYGSMIVLMAVSLHLYACQLEERLGVEEAKSVRKLLDRSAIFMIAAFGLWNVDNIWCDRLRGWRSTLPSFLSPFLQFHAWWHILTMISGTHSMTAMLTAYCKCQDKRQKIIWQLRACCNGMIPWVTIKKASKKQE